MNLDRQKLKQVFQEMGYSVEFDSKTPGIEQLDGSIIPFNKIPVVYKEFDPSELGYYSTFALSHDEASTFKPKKCSVLVRILDKGMSYEPIQYMDQYTNVIEMYFTDIDPIRDEMYDEEEWELTKSTLNPFDSEKADFLINELDWEKKAEQIVVHCHAGISRSVAIALFLAKYYFEDDENFEAIMKCPKYLPGGNRYVYQLLEEEFEKIK